jgi:hypothetical protein
MNNRRSPEQTDILRRLEQYYHTGPLEKIRFDADDRIIVDGYVSLEIGTKSLNVRFAKINGSFNAHDRNLSSLAGAPEEVTEFFDVSRNRLTSLEGGPKEVGGDYLCWRNKLTSLVGAPERVGGRFEIYKNPLTSLVGMPNFIGDAVSLSYHPALPLLRTLVAPAIELSIGADIVSLDRIYLCETILNKYAGEGKRGVIRCQKELIAAGFEGNAKW